MLLLVDVESLLLELCEVVQHAFQHLGGVALPAGEILHLRWADVDLAAREIRFEGSTAWWTVNGSTARPRAAAAEWSVSTNEQ